MAGLNGRGRNDIRTTVTGGNLMFQETGTIGKGFILSRRLDGGAGRDGGVLRKLIPGKG